MFGEWLSEQTNRKDEAGRFARIAWEDHTSGCAKWFGGALEWRDHISKYHPAKLDEVMPFLRSAYVAYAADNNLFRA